MEGKSSAGSNLTPSGFGGFLSLQGSMQLNDQLNLDPYQSFMGMDPQEAQDVFPFRVWNMQESNQTASFLDCESEKVKNAASDDDRLNVVEEGVDGHNEGGTEKKESPWQRVKWTDGMVKLLITAVSYIGEDAGSDNSGGGRRSSSLLPKKGKWKAVSKVMVERGCHVSPQQCEDKFNDLNKRYKRLNDILGRGTSCKVVENPALMDLMDLSDKAKEDVTKILSSKQLFYQEMCSYHNRNRLYLPHDRALQQSMLLALKGKVGCESHNVSPYKPVDLDEEEENAEPDRRNDDNEENYFLHKDDGGIFVFPGVSAKRKRQGEEHEVEDFGNGLNFWDCGKRLYRHPHNEPHPPFFTEGGEGERLQTEWIMSRSLQLEEQKLQIRAQMVELEKQRFEWLRFSLQEDRELDKMRLENEGMKLENERLALELKRRVMSSMTTTE